MTEQRAPGADFFKIRTNFLIGAIVWIACAVAVGLGANGSADALQLSGLLFLMGGALLIGGAIFWTVGIVIQHRAAPVEQPKA